MKITPSYAIKYVLKKVELMISIPLIKTVSLVDPTDIPEVKCFLQGAINHGLIWSQTNTNVLSDGTYAANTAGYQTLKTDIQTRCQKEKFKRQLLRALRKLYEDADEN
jgi:hypothetical protein